MFTVSNASDPVGMAIEASKAVALFLQWWEMRRQTLLQSAAFEERRLSWLADIMWTSQRPAVGSSDWLGAPAAIAAEATGDQDPDFQKTTAKKVID